VATLKNDLEKLRGEVDSKDGAIDSLQSQVKSMQEEHTVVVAKHEKDGSTMRDMLASQKDFLSNAREVHAKELESAKKAHSDEVATLKNDLEKLRGEVDSKDGAIDSLQSQVKSMQEEHTVVVAKHEKDGSTMRDMLASQNDGHSNMKVAMKEAEDRQKEDLRKIHDMVEENNKRYHSLMATVNESIAVGNEGLKAELMTVRKEVKSRDFIAPEDVAERKESGARKNRFWKLVSIFALIYFLFSYLSLLQYKRAFEDCNLCNRTSIVANNSTMTSEEKLKSQKLEKLVMDLNGTLIEMNPKIEDLKQNNSKQEVTILDLKRILSDTSSKLNESEYASELMKIEMDALNIDLSKCQVKVKDLAIDVRDLRHDNVTCGKELLTCRLKVDLSEKQADALSLKIQGLQIESDTCDEALLTCQDDITSLKRDLHQSQIDIGHALSTRDEKLVSMTEVISTCNSNLSSLQQHNEVLDEDLRSCSNKVAELGIDVVAGYHTSEDLIVCQNNLDASQKDNATCSEKLLSCCHNGVGRMNNIVAKLNSARTGSARPSRWQANSSIELQQSFNRKDAWAIVVGVTVAFIAPHLSSFLGILFSPSVATMTTSATLSAVEKKADIKKMAMIITTKVNKFLTEAWSGGAVG